MTIILYNEIKNEILIAIPNEVTKIIQLNDPNLLQHIPDDTIMYVNKCNLITKDQFQKWMNGEYNFQVNEKATRSSYLTNDPLLDIPQDKKYIHPAANGAILIDDIKTDKYPNGIQLIGKYDFMDVDEIGMETLQNSRKYNWLIKNKKLAISDQQYYNKYKNKNRQVSASEAELNKILLPAGVKAEDYILGKKGKTSKYDNYDGVIEIDID